VGSERRQFARLKDSVRIRYREIRSDAFPGKESDGFTINISGGGVCFATEKHVENGQLLAVEMKIPEFESPVVTLGRVVWCEKGSQNYEVGAEFWWIGWGDEKVQRSIGDYIRRALEKS
jgi:PilZ domain